MLALKNVWWRLRQGIKAFAPRWYLRRLVGSGEAINTHMTLKERIGLFEMARASCRLNQFLEVGSYLGASSVVIAEAARRSGDSASRLFCIDTWQNDAMKEGRRSTFDEFSRNTVGWKDVITPLIGDSADVVLPANILCDLVFIDGDHSYDGVSSDLGKFSRYVRPDGILAMHDYHSSREGVVKAASEIISTGSWRVAYLIDTLLCLRRSAAGEEVHVLSSERPA